MGKRERMRSETKRERKKTIKREKMKDKKKK